MTAPTTPRISPSIDGGVAVSQRSVSLLRLQNGFGHPAGSSGRRRFAIWPFWPWFADHAVWQL